MPYFPTAKPPLTPTALTNVPIASSTLNNSSSVPFAVLYFVIANPPLVPFGSSFT